MRRDPIAVARAMAQRLVERYGPGLVILFGSRARGDADADSDIDLLVVMPFDGSRLLCAVELRKALRGFYVAKDVVVLRPEEYDAQKDVPGTMAYPAAHEGVVLHAA